ncbi:MAG: hypothetical protein J5J00_00260 [Deltaproteobacteria bacterium]|nr:hypothetical protein [Deltaproteobacteria bacterium]
MLSCNNLNYINHSKVKLPQHHEAGNRRCSASTGWNQPWPRPPQGEPWKGADSSLLDKIVERFVQIVEGLTGILERALNVIGTAQAEEAAPAEAPEAPAEATAEVSPPVQEPQDSSVEASKLKKNGEFLWKPQSDKDGNLVILLPGNISGKVKSVKVLDPGSGEVLARGRDSGLGNPVNGKERRHFRFNKPGNSFPDSSIVEIQLKGGKKFRVKVPDTAQRFIR